MAMKNIKTIFLKEMKRFFTEPRMLAALFLPGIIICIIYSLLGSFMESSFSTSSSMPTNYTYNIALTDNYQKDESATSFIELTFDEYLKENEKSNKVNYIEIKKEEVETYKTRVVEGEFDLLVSFDDEFENKLFEQNSSQKPNISLFYNGANEISTYTYSIVSSLVNATYTNFTVNIENNALVDANLSTENFTFKNIMSFVIPLVTISLLFSTVISICPEAIAGEKERGTLASVLMTPIKRSELAIGKISALTIVSLASGIVSFLGLIISLPNLYGGGVNLASLFSPSAFIMLLLLITTSLIVFVTLGLLISTFAKSIKEAGSYLTPLMTILMIAAIIPFSVDMSNIGFAFIPLLNIVSSMNLLIKETSMALLVPYLAVTVVINLVIAGVLVFITAKMFNSEQVMFQR